MTSKGITKLYRDKDHLLVTAENSYARIVHSRTKIELTKTSIALGPLDFEFAKPEWQGYSVHTCLIPLCAMVVALQEFTSGSAQVLLWGLEEEIVQNHWQNLISEKKLKASSNACQLRANEVWQSGKEVSLPTA